MAHSSHRAHHGHGGHHLFGLAFLAMIPGFRLLLLLGVLIVLCGG